MVNFEEKIEGAVIEAGKEVVSDLVRPTAQSIGNNIGLLVDGVMGWLGYWGERQKAKRTVYLEDYKRKITENILGIQEDKLIEPNMRIVGPAIEASKYFIEEECCRDLFAKLIASSCDSSESNFVHPAFPEIIKQLTPIDARFLVLFKKYATYPVVELQEVHEDKKITPFLHMLFDFKDCSVHFESWEQLELTKTVESLSRFGLLIKNTGVIELDYNYDNFKEHWFYKAVTPTISENSTVKMIKYRVELTMLGRDFVRSCVPDHCEIVKE